MKFIDKYFYIILLLFILFFLFCVSFWNVFIVPLRSEVSTNVSRLMAQEERILYSFFASDEQQIVRPDKKILLKKQTIAELKKTYAGLLYADKSLWLKSQSFCRFEYDFMNEVEKKFFRVMFAWFVLFSLFLMLQIANRVDLRNIFDKIVLLLITTVLLVYIESINADRNFYFLMKVAVFMTSFYLVFGMIKNIKSNLFFWLFVITGIIFNPFFNLHFGEKSGLNINLYTAGMLVIYCIVLCLQNKKNKSLKRQF